MKLFRDGPPDYHVTANGIILIRCPNCNTLKPEELVYNYPPRNGKYYTCCKECEKQRKASK